jgi:hypothetical protein
MRNSVDLGQTSVLLAELRKSPGVVHRAPAVTHGGYPFLNFLQQRMQQNAIFIWVIHQ